MTQILLISYYGNELSFPVVDLFDCSGSHSLK